MCKPCPPALPCAPGALCRRLHFDLGLDLRCVYELDSSTPAKFSRHLTLRLPGHAFANNHAMGKFVAQVRGYVSWPADRLEPGAGASVLQWQQQQQKDSINLAACCSNTMPPA